MCHLPLSLVAVTECFIECETRNLNLIVFLCNSTGCRILKVSHSCWDHAYQSVVVR